MNKPIEELLRLMQQWPIDTQLSVDHDGFKGRVRGYYFTIEGKPGLVLQQNGNRVVHVYAEKWFMKKSKSELTDSQRSALNAIASRNGTGVFDNHGVLVCAGERLGFTRHTWNVLAAGGFITIAGKRATLTNAGREEVGFGEYSSEHVALSDLYSGDNDEEEA